MTQPHRPKGSRLGFGTGAFHARQARADQIRLIHAAIDAGITHIDTARLYGDGTAEAIVGEAIRGRRGDVFLVSKAGIDPPHNGPVRRAMNKALSMGRKLPLGEATLPEPTWSEPEFGQFDPNHLRASLERSLKDLDTDYLDLFLLHEVDVEHLASGAVIDALEDWKKEGLFVSYGIASTREQTSRILAGEASNFPVVQTASSVFDADDTGFAATDRLLITHSWLGATLARFKDAFEADPALAVKAGRCLYADVRRTNRLAACFLEHALHANPDGQVLFSTSRVDRIPAMARIAEKPRMTAEQFDALAVIVRRICEMEKMAA